MKRGYLLAVLFLFSFLVIGVKLTFAAGAAAAVSRVQRTPDKQRQSLLEEEAKKEGTFSYYGTMSTDQATRLLALFRTRYPFFTNQSLSFRLNGLVEQNSHRDPEWKI
jgi:hypothetical protein